MKSFTHSKITALIAFSLLLLSFCTVHAEEIAFYVSPQGNDSWAGDSIDTPFASIQKARDAIRAIKRQPGLANPVTVYIRGGLYELSEPLLFTVEDSGTESCPVTYTAYKNETPIISGGRALHGEWQDYKGNIKVMNLSGEWDFRQLFVNGKRQTRARTPNVDYYRIELTEEELDRTEMKYREGDIDPNWRNLDDVEIVLFHSWNESKLYIDNIDTENRIVTYTGRIGGQRLGKNVERTNRYYIVNLFEGLDRPGEWYLDKKQNKLYYYPPNSTEGLDIRVPILTRLVTFQGDMKNDKYVEYITINGLTFCDTEWALPPEGYPTCGDVGDIVQPSAITLDGTNYCTLKNNCIRNVGTYAVEVTGDGNKIIDNEIHDTGGGGIISRSYGKERNEMCYNHIHHTGKIFHSATGINIDDGGGLISHNLIHDISQSGIYTRHWKNRPTQFNPNVQEQERRNQEQGLIIEYNEIYNISSLLNDSGGMFVRDSNILIKNNLIHDVYSYYFTETIGDYNDGGVPGWGIYLGCETRDTRLENNIMYRMREGVHVFHGTRNVTMENNMFIDAHIRQIRYETRKEYPMPNNRFVRNIVYNSSPYTELFNVGSGEYALPTESDYNLFYHAGHKTPIVKGRREVEIDLFDEWKARGFDIHSIVADPLFTDPDNHDYTLLPDSPAFKIGFKPIDMSTVGLRGR